jgi:hypothetical protein
LSVHLHSKLLSWPSVEPHGFTADDVSLWSWHEGYAATTGDADHLSHFGEAKVKIADSNICGRNSHHLMLLFDDPVVGIIVGWATILSLATAAAVHVHSNSTKICFSSSVLDWETQSIASSAYRRNWSDSDIATLLTMTQPP